LARQKGLGVAIKDVPHKMAVEFLMQVDVTNFHFYPY
jgi:hypothetical protein